MENIWPYREGLSGGAIAGISVGAVVVVSSISYFTMFGVYAKTGKGLKFLFKSFDGLKKFFKIKFHLLLFLSKPLLHEWLFLININREINHLLIDFFWYPIAMNEDKLFDVRITVVKISVFKDLIDKYENPIAHACALKVGDSFISINGNKPKGFCDSAWSVLSPFVKDLSEGRGNFYDGWMKDPFSAMISCNDGFRPVSFYLERIGPISN